jgi:hypothetical protein
MSKTLSKQILTIGLPFLAAEDCFFEENPSSNTNCHEAIENENLIPLYFALRHPCVCCRHGIGASLAFPNGEGVGRKSADANAILDRTKLRRMS